MAAKRRISCLLFDLGSTLWTRREEAIAQAKEQAYGMAGAILRRAKGEEAFSSMEAVATGTLIHKALARQLRQEKRLRPEYEPDFVLATLEVLRELGFTGADSALAEVIFETLRVRIPDSRALFTDTLSTLTTLKQRGYLLGVVTNRDYGGPLFREDIRVMGLLDYFEYEHMAISADLGIRKPHPAIFRYALNRLNVLPEEAAMVGDNLTADIAGAKRLNMFAVWKPKPSPQAEAREQFALEQDELKPDMTINQLSELLEVF